MKKLIISLSILLSYNVSIAQSPKVDSTIITFDKYGNQYTTIYTSNELNTKTKDTTKIFATKPKKVK